jgi:NAD(P)-dependent dehydrogenase (short-subunit alcohol dehydrogenase family)
MDQPSFQPLDLRGRHYLVTGAASGIGRAIAVLLDRLGASTSLVDLEPAGLARTVALLGAGPHRSFTFDLRQTDHIDTLVASVVGAGGALHGVVHAAGIQKVTPVKILTVAIWRELLAVNTEAGLALAKTLANRRVYAGADGSVVFISSVMGLTGSPGAIAYSMSKSALHGMAKSLALELASRKIRVNCVAPGFVRTPLFERTEKLWNEEQRKQVEARHPLGFGAPEDVANAVAFLLADTGRWITGTVLVVDGGYMAQ